MPTCTAHTARTAMSLLALLLFTALCRGATLSGIVVDADERPAAGVPVWVYCASPNGDEGMGAVTQCTSGAAGAFSADVPGEVPDPDSDGTLRVWHIYAHRPGTAIAHFSCPDVTFHPWLRLSNPSPVVGRVLGPDGTPLAGAEVGLRHAMGFPALAAQKGYFAVPPEIMRGLMVRTDAEGAFSLALLPKWWQPGVLVRAQGLGELATSVDVGGAEVRLQRPGRIVGQIIAPAGVVPPAGLQIEASGSISDTAYAEARAPVDAQGRFELPELPPGSYAVALSSQPQGECRVRGLADVKVRSAETTTVTLEAARGSLVRGRVVRAETKEPIAGAHIDLVTSSEGSSLRDTVSCRSDADGRFETFCLPGETIVFVTDPGRGAGASQVSSAITVGSDPLDAGDIVLPAAQSIEFRTVDEAEAPVPGADVLLRSQPEFPAWPVGTSDATGRYVLQGAGGEAPFTAVKGELRSTELRWDPAVNTGLATLVLKPQPASGFRVRLADQRGAPVTTARVTLEEKSEHSRDEAHCPPPDLDGTLAVSGLTPDSTYSLRIEADDCDTLQLPDWTARAGAVEDLGTAALRRHAGRLHGTVLAPDGEPMAGARVWVSLDSPTLRETITGADGRFSLSGLVEGSVYLFVDAPACAFAAEPLRTGDEEVRVTLRPQQATPPGAAIPSLVAPGPPEPLATARRLLTRALDATPVEETYWRARLLSELAKLDPAAAYEIAARDNDDPAPVDLAVGRAMLAQDTDEGLALMTQRNSAQAVGEGLVAAAGELQSADPPRARECLEATIELAGTVAEPATQLELLAMAGSGLFWLDRPRGEQVLRRLADMRSLLPASERDTPRRRAVARALGLVDVDAALEMLRDGTDGPDTLDWSVGSVAAELARVDADRALKLASGIGQPYARDRAMAAILGYLPSERLDEAIKRARGIGYPIPRAMALCRLAQAAPPERRRELLWQAAQGVQDECRESLGSGGHVEGAADALCRLSMVARRLGLPDYRELAWRAASVRVRGSGYYSERRLNIMYDFSLARLMAFCDPDLARHIVDAAVDCAGGEEGLPRGYIGAMAQLDPEGALKHVEAALAGPTTSPENPTDLVSALLDVLTKSPDQRETDLLAEPDGSWLLEARDAISASAAREQ